MGRGENGLVSDVYVGRENDDWYNGDESYYEEGETPSWRDVFAYVFNRSFLGWLKLFACTILFLALLYGYSFGIVLLGSSVEVLSGCHISSLFTQRPLNSITCTLLGILGTSMFQSSTATNVLIGTLVGDVLTVQQCIFIAIGANVGNTVINSALALAHCRNKSDLERVVAGASANEFYLLYAILIFLPIEAFTGMLYHISAALLPQTLNDRYQWSGFVGNYVVPYVNKLIQSNQVLLSGIISGVVESCSSMYPISCTDGDCTTGIIGCDLETNSCPFLYKSSTSVQSDIGGGLVALAISIGIISLCLVGIMKMVHNMLIDTPVEVMAIVTNVNNYVLMLFGCFGTFLVGSSSISEAIFNPALAYGMIEVEKMLPWSLGSNIGMALLMVIQATFSGNIAYFHVALANLLFNLFGTIIWYPFPFVRKFPLHSSLILGVVTRQWRITPIFHVGFWFFGLPYMVLGILDLLSSDDFKLKAAGIVCLIVLALLTVPSMLWWFFGSGKVKFITYFEESKDVLSMDDGSIISMDSSSEGSSIAPSSVGGGYEVKFKKEEKEPRTAAKNVVTNTKQSKKKAKSYHWDGKSNYMEQNLYNMKPKPPQPRSNKRLRKTRRKQTNEGCCADVEGCGIMS